MAEQELLGFVFAAEVDARTKPFSQLSSALLASIWASNSQMRSMQRLFANKFPFVTAS